MPTWAASALPCTGAPPGCWPATAPTTASSRRTCSPPSPKRIRGPRRSSPPPGAARWRRGRRTSRCGCCGARHRRPRHPALARPAQFRTGLDPLASLDQAAATGDPEVAAEATRLAATALVLRSEPRAAAGRLRAALEHAPPSLAGELEEQLVETLAYSDDDAPEYLRVVERARGQRPADAALHRVAVRERAGVTRPRQARPA